MNPSAPARRQLIEAINKLPLEVLPELENYLHYLQFKLTMPAALPDKAQSGSGFLLSIAGLGEAEADLSERDEDILRKEIDPLRGWTFKPECQP